MLSTAVGVGLLFNVVAVAVAVAEDWTAAEELSLADQTRRMGLGAWDEISDSVSASRGCTHCLALHEMI